MTWFLPMRGRTAARCSKPASNVISPNMSWKNTADMPMVAIARAIAAAIGTPSTPQRVDSDTSATTITVAVLGCSNSRTMSGLKLVSDDCGQSIDEKRSPGCQSRRPTKSKPGAVEQAAMLADRELAHPLQDEQLDLGDVRQVDERRSLASCSADVLIRESAPARRRPR